MSRDRPRYEMTSVDVFEVASNSVHAYVDDARQRAASTDLEDRLQRGIEAFRVLTLADELMRRAAYQGVFAISPDLKRAVGELYQLWLAQCEEAEQLLQSPNRDVSPETLTAFVNTLERGREVIDRQAYLEAAASTASALSAKEEW